MFHKKQGTFPTQVSQIGEGGRSDRALSAREDVFLAFAKLLILVGLSIWFFWPELLNLASIVSGSSETAHTLITPIAILLLMYLRRKAIVENLTKGSLWGVVFIVIGLGIYACASWPFTFGYAHYIAIIPVLAGIILVVCGWRVLSLSFPMLILILLSIPIGTRLYATLALLPEKYTTSITAAVLRKLPGINIVVQGVDLFFYSDNSSGVIGLGESNRAARLMLSFATIGVFVIFSQIRTLWRVIIAAIVAVPILLFCNFLRFLSWGLIMIYTRMEPTSSLPRNISTVCSLFTAYCFFSLACGLKLNLFADPDTNCKDIKTEKRNNVPE